METILAAVLSSVITGGLALAGTLAASHAQAEKTRALLDYRLTELEKKQDKHNSVIERTYHIEKDLAVAQDQIKSAHHRIDSLEAENHEKD